MQKISSELVKLDIYNKDHQKSLKPPKQLVCRLLVKWKKCFRLKYILNFNVL